MHDTDSAQNIVRESSVLRYGFRTQFFNMRKVYTPSGETLKSAYRISKKKDR